jgi:hypothetical protein
VWSVEDPGSGNWQQLEGGLSVHDGFVGRFFDEQLVTELADQWEFDAATPYDEGQRRLWRVTLTKPES